MASFSTTLKRIRNEKGMSQEEFASFLGTSKQNISRYESGEVSPKITTAAKMAEKLGITLSQLNGEMSATESDEPPLLANLIPVKRRRIPLLGGIAAGEPIFANEEHEDYVEANDNIPCDYALRVEGDSMEPTVRLGDVVFIRQQDDVNDGQIAAVLVDDSATLKRVFHIPNGLQLLSDNAAKYPPRSVTFEDYDCIRILGRAVAYKRKL